MSFAPQRLLELQEFPVAHEVAQDVGRRDVEEVLLEPLDALGLDRRLERRDWHDAGDPTKLNCKFFQLYSEVTLRDARNPGIFEVGAWSTPIWEPLHITYYTSE